MANVGEIGEQLTAAVLTEDVDNVTSRYAADAVLESPEGVFTGHEEIGRFFDGWFSPFSQPEVVETEKLESGDQMMVESYFSATHSERYVTASGETIAPTGRRIKVRAMEAYRVKDGAVTEHRLYYDRLDLLEQLR